MILLYALVGIIFYLWLVHLISYSYLKNRILRSRRWDLNICCGKTDGGGINADIKKHKDVPNFRLIKDIYHLPFKDKEFNTLLCSHTVEHVENPERFFNELQRVSRNVTLVVPPLYDLAAVLNIFEHKWIFLTLRKKHKRLPRHVRLPLSRFIQKLFGQVIHA